MESCLMLCTLVVPIEYLTSPLEVLSWGLLALVPVAVEALPALMICVLLSNLGASITEVAKDALAAEYGQKHKLSGLQSYAFMALAAGGILGNLFGGFFLRRMQPKTMFLMFMGLLSLQLVISLTTREDSLGLPQPSNHNLARNSVLKDMRKQFSDLRMAISNESISGPLIWAVVSIAMVPILSGSIFCYQTQCLNLDPSILGMSRVIGQLMLLSTTVLYDRFWKRVSLRKLIGMVQISYALTLLLDLVLVKQINLKLGISNAVFALCFSGIAETIAQFKVLPFLVLFASSSPPGCEGSLTSFLASALCLSSIVSGFLGVGLASLVGITSGNYSSLPVGIVIQFLAALVPVMWICQVPTSQPSAEKELKRGRSKGTRRNRRVERVLFDSVYAFCREREYEAPR
ncbi:probable folate-biopterin transporter 8, chloroplastic isoform X2 [Malania oleifera]|uniref:probable folate-biopterin transporter 8, chloroplastic isoform X2 n=1 Tax=Malania oleifera TaxID=397392 RepID=UPI0025AE9D65|nr:probable folate-biopterin transporter 8, chloroplastic isoform X2 [Malania oleifera]